MFSSYHHPQHALSLFWNLGIFSATTIFIKGFLWKESCVPSKVKKLSRRTQKDWCRINMEYSVAQNAFNSECKRTQGIFPQIILKTWGENSLFLPAVFQFLKRILNLYFSHHTFLWGVLRHLAPILLLIQFFWWRYNNSLLSVVLSSNQCYYWF